ncbi:acyltransferase family protein, partial [Rothia nasimurium]|uniref:acyltransferase family protein n=1 Tax=Rothia nasimurium TaxID=85336 RepID=UPI001F19D934
RLQNLILGLSILILLVFSLAFAQEQVNSGQAGAYFNTFTRTWEFMVGALIALSAPLLARLLPQDSEPVFITLIRNLSQLVAYVAIGFSAFLFTGESGVPGLATLIPVLSTALIIALGPTAFIPWLRALVEWRPVQFTGDISYSLYLWHWPIVVLLPFALGKAAHWSHYLIAIPFVYLLAFITQRLIENTFRFKIPSLFVPKTVLFAVTTSLALVGTSSLATHFYAQKQIAQQQAQIQASLNQTSGAEIENDPSSETTDESQQPKLNCVGGMALVNQESCHNVFSQAPLIPAGTEDEAPWIPRDQECEILESVDVPNGGARVKIHCDYTNNDPETKKVWFIGDSHIDHWRPAVYPIAREKQWDTTFYSHSGCSLWEAPLTYWFAPGRQAHVPQVFSDTCPKWPGLILDQVTQEKPDLIVIGNYSSTQGLEDGSGSPQKEQYSRAMKPWIEKWKAQGSQVLVMRDVPTAGTSIGPDCVAYSGVECTAPASSSLWSDPQFEAAKSLGVATIDMTDYFCPDGTCYGVIGGLPVFYDTNHVSKSYSVSLTRPLGTKLEEAITE